MTGQITNYLFAETNIKKIVIKVFVQWLIDGNVSWKFGNDFARNVVIRGVRKGSQSHTDNHKYNFLVLSEGPIYEINDNFGSLEKTFSFNFSKPKKNFI